MNSIIGDIRDLALVKKVFLEKQPEIVIHMAAQPLVRYSYLEPLSGYLQLAEKLYTDGCTFAEAWNFGPKPEDAKPVEWIVKKIAGQWGDNADWLVDEGEHPHEAYYLKLDCSKANERFQWFPQWSLAEALSKIVEWLKWTWRIKI